jgi:hypothetical protein
MNVTVIKEDRVVVVDGEALNFNYALDSSIWAIQWNGTTGEIEYNDGTPIATISDFAPYQYLIDEHAAEKVRAAAQAVTDEAAAEAALTYAEKRKAKYDALNQFEMQYDDLVNTTTTWPDAIAAIKLEIPKV